MLFKKKKLCAIKINTELFFKHVKCSEFNVDEYFRIAEMKRKLALAEHSSIHSSDLHS